MLRMCVLFLWYAGNFSPPSAGWPYHPSHLSRSRQLLHSLSFFFKHRNTHSLTPPWAICHTSLWGSLVVVLSSKLLCCISQPNAHLTSWRPLQVSSLWGVCRVLTYSDTYAHDPVTALTWMMNWLCCGSLHTAISLSSPAQGCSFISGYCVSAVHTTHSAQDKQPRKYWEKLLF